MRTVIVAVVFAAFAVQSPARAQDLVLEFCPVMLDKEAKLSAEEAGVLMNLDVEQGSRPQAGAVLATVDDRQANLQKMAAKAGWDAAEEKAKNDIETRYAKSAAEVAELEYKRMTEANKRTPNAIAEIEVQRALLQWKTTQLQIQKAAHEQYLATFDAASKNAEFLLAELGIKRRTLVAPFDGVVVELYRHQNEWVNPGDPILHLVQLDKMRVEKYIEQSKYDPHEIDGCKVTVELELAHNRTATFTGKVTFVSPLLDPRGKYTAFLVRALVDNRQENGHYILRPNHQPKMTIHLGTATAANVPARTNK
jgi:multidrug resistance efflux pump